MDFEEAASSPVLSLSTSSSSGWTAVGVDSSKRESEGSAKSIHPLALRPWDITVLVNLHRVHGRLPVVSVRRSEERAMYCELSQHRKRARAFRNGIARALMISLPVFLLSLSYASAAPCNYRTFRHGIELVGVLGP